MKKLCALVCFGCLCVTLLGAQQLENSVKEAVNGLATKLRRQYEVTIGPMTREQLGVSVPFSRRLHNLVNYYAVKNHSDYFKIVNVAATRSGPKRLDEPQRGIITGTFEKRGDKIEGFLFLDFSDGTRAGTEKFVFPFSEITEDISIEPENIAIVEKQEQIFTKIDTGAAIKGINIQAFFNAESMTYLHGDELQMTVSADKDCYFKIIHIDVDNKIKMIYPKKGDNNFLRANTSRAVFDNPNSRQILCEPYGAETLVLVASPVQFPNIEREYNEPWKAATEETIAAAIAGTGQARYPISIIKPHEQYEYAKPDMTELYRSIRDDTVRQGGYFSGNATSGFYIVNNIRGSYRAPSGKPDTVQFATYYLDAYTAESYRGARTRGSAFNFSFAKPQNLNAAVQTVRSSIMEKGGTFTGNEQEGNFKASGIAGQYKVTDLVSVTISEKPFVIPNSLIVNEVKNFFGVR